MGKGPTVLTEHAQPRAAGEALTLWEAAHAIADGSGARESASTVEHICETLERAVVDPDPARRLCIRHPETRLPERFEDWPDPSCGCLVVLRSDLDAWLRATGVPWTLPADSGAAPGAPGGRESEEDRQRRRFDRFEAIGGKYERQRDGTHRQHGRRGAIEEVAREEAAAGRPYRSASDVGKDIRAEARRRWSARTNPPLK